MEIIKTSYRNRVLWALLAFVILLLGLWLSVIILQFRQCNIPYPVHFVRSNIFVSQVWPEPGAKIPRHCYFRQKTNDTIFLEGHGIGGSILVVADELWHQAPAPPIVQRVNLFLNNKIVQDEFMFTEMGLAAVYCPEPGQCQKTGLPAAWSVAWYPKLERGRYDARLEFIRDTGELLTYEWSFSITGFP